MPSNTKRLLNFIPQVEPGDEMTVTEKGLVMRDFPGGGLVTGMDPQDAVSEELLVLQFSK